MAATVASPPDIAKHVRDTMGGLVLELATAKAIIEALEKSLAEARAHGGSPNGARGADGSDQGVDHG